MRLGTRHRSLLRHLKLKQLEELGLGGNSLIGTLSLIRFNSLAYGTSVMSGAINLTRTIPESIDNCIRNFACSFQCCLSVEYLVGYFTIVAWPTSLYETGVPISLLTISYSV